MWEAWCALFGLHGPASRMRNCILVPHGLSSCRQSLGAFLACSQKIVMMSVTLPVGELIIITILYEI